MPPCNILIGYGLPCLSARKMICETDGEIYCRMLLGVTGFYFNSNVVDNIEIALSNQSDQLRSLVFMIRYSFYSPRSFISLLLELLSQIIPLLLSIVKVLSSTTYNWWCMMRSLWLEFSSIASLWSTSNGLALT